LIKKITFLSICQVNPAMYDQIIKIGFNSKESQSAQQVGLFFNYFSTLFSLCQTATPPMVLLYADQSRIPL